MFRVHHGLVACPGSPFPLQIPVCFCPCSLQHSTHSAAMVPLVLPRHPGLLGVRYDQHTCCSSFFYLYLKLRSFVIFTSCVISPGTQRPGPVPSRLRKLSGRGASPDRTPPPEIPLCHPEASEGTHALLHERKHGSQERTGASGLDLEAERGSVVNPWADSMFVLKSGSATAPWYMTIVLTSVKLQTCDVLWSLKSCIYGSGIS